VVGVEGQGKMALARLALYVSQYACQELSVSKEFDRDDWQSLLKNMITSTAFNRQTTVLNIQENQISDDIILIDLDCILKNGYLPDLLLASEQDVFDKHVAGSLTPAELSSGIPESNLVFNEFCDRVRYHFKSVINISPSGRILKNELKDHQSIINCSTMIWMDAWPEEGYRSVGRLKL
jgi:dynein heavy chain